MKQDTNPRLPAEPARLAQRLTDLLSRLADQVNRLTEGQASAVHNAQAAPPASGTWAEGDFIKNSAPAELGSLGSKYVIEGWMRVGGAWLEKRFLTGN